MADYIYLDYAAATPLDPAVLDAMLPYLQAEFYNPSAIYSPARQVRQAINDARSKIAANLGCRPAEIVFTAGGTEANNLAIHGVMSRYPDGNLLVSAIEHEATIEPASQFNATVVPVKADGRIDVLNLAKTIDQQTVLVSIMMANNEIGVIQPMRDIARVIKTIRIERQAAGNKRPLYFHTDACQAATYINLNVARLGVDLMTLNGGKMYGPKQTGLLYIKGGIVLGPLIRGGGQEQGMRSGTENVAGIIGLAKAFELTNRRREAEVRRLTVLRDYFISHLLSQHPDATVNGSIKYRLPNNVHVTLPGCDNERLIIGFDLAGIAVAAGSACSARSDRPSHVLGALGMGNQSARSTIRFTMGLSTTESQLDTVLKTLAALR